MVTKYDELRAIEAQRFDPKRDPGAMGRRYELECARPLSKKIKVSKQGETDVFIRLDGKYVKAEVKTNGGRIQGFMESSKSKYIIYRLQAEQYRKPTKAHPDGFHVRWECESVIVPREQFIQALLECKAIKHTNGKNDELAIQPFNRPFEARLKAWPVKFDRMRDYTSADFEGLTF